MNDGCVAPNNDVICGKGLFSTHQCLSFTQTLSTNHLNVLLRAGTKDSEFEIAAKRAATFQFREGRFTQIVLPGETCANGNAFIQIEGRNHLLHIDTPTKKIVAYPYHLVTGRIDNASSTVIDFHDPAVFEAAPGTWHKMLLPDGVCHWITEDKKDKLIVAIFDARTDQLRSGQALQFDVTNGKVCLSEVKRSRCERSIFTS